MFNDFTLQFLNRLAHRLEANGIAKRERNTWLKNVLGIDISNAGRKLKGMVAFNLEEMTKVAKALRCTTDELLGLSDTSAAAQSLSEQLPGFSFRGLGLQTTLISERLPASGVITVAARMHDSADHADYIVWLSAEPNRHPAHFAAWQEVESTSWWIGPVKEMPTHLMGHDVYAYLALGPGIRPYSVAVLDDRAETAEIMQSFLQQAGYIADTFTHTDDLRQALAHNRFDAFILDWSMGNGETAESLIQEIRRKDGIAIPIVLLTGEASESEIERAIDQFGVRYFQKTGLFKPIIAQLKKDLREYA